MRTLFGCIALVSLTACGYKGPLYLPTPAQQARLSAKASSVVASKPAARQASVSEQASAPVAEADKLGE